MKPKKDSSTSEMDESTADSLQVVQQLVLLIVEARTPDQSVKGRVEGPHCALVGSGGPGGSLGQGSGGGGGAVAQTAHQCRLDKQECVRADQFCQSASRLWRNGIPVCVDILLFPACTHGKQEVGVMEGTVTMATRENALLVERWTVEMERKRATNQSQPLHPSLLLQAVRSYLHFSQISSWLYSSGGCLPGLVLVYRICAPCEESTSDLADFSDSHSFPVCITNRQQLRVRVNALNRRSTVPALMCVDYDHSSAAQVASASVAATTRLRPLKTTTTTSASTTNTNATDTNIYSYAPLECKRRVVDDEKDKAVRVPSQKSVNRPAILREQNFREEWKMRADDGYDEYHKDDICGGGIEKRKKDGKPCEDVFVMTDRRDKQRREGEGGTNLGRKIDKRQEELVHLKSGGKKMTLDGFRFGKTVPDYIADQRGLVKDCYEKSRRKNKKSVVARSKAKSEFDCGEDGDYGSRMMDKIEPADKGKGFDLCRYRGSQDFCPDFCDADNVEEYEGDDGETFVKDGLCFQILSPIEKRPESPLYRHDPHRAWNSGMFDRLGSCGQKHVSRLEEFEYVKRKKEAMMMMGGAGGEEVKLNLNKMRLGEEEVVRAIVDQEIFSSVGGGDGSVSEKSEQRRRKMKEKRKKDGEKDLRIEQMKLGMTLIRRNDDEGNDDDNEEKGDNYEEEEMSVAEKCYINEHDNDIMALKLKVSVMENVKSYERENCESNFGVGQCRMKSKDAAIVSDHENKEDFRDSKSSGVSITHSGSMSDIDIRDVGCDSNQHNCDNVQVSLLPANFCVKDSFHVVNVDLKGEQVEQNTHNTSDQQVDLSSLSASPLCVDVSFSSELDFDADSDATPIASPNSNSNTLTRSSGTDSLFKLMTERKMMMMNSNNYQQEVDGSGESGCFFNDEAMIQTIEVDDIGNSKHDNAVSEEFSQSCQLPTSSISHTFVWSKEHGLVEEEEEANPTPKDFPKFITKLNQPDDAIRTTDTYNKQIGTFETNKSDNGLSNTTVKTSSTISRKMFQENLLPLASYDAKTDSFKKVEESMQSGKGSGGNILHSPKVLFSCDVPEDFNSMSCDGDGEGVGRKYIDFEKVLTDSQFFKNKLQDVFGYKDGLGLFGEQEGRSDASTSESAEEGNDEEKQSFGKVDEVGMKNYLTSCEKKKETPSYFLSEESNLKSKGSASSVVGRKDGMKQVGMLKEVYLQQQHNHQQQLTTLPPSVNRQLFGQEFESKKVDSSNPAPSSSSSLLIQSVPLSSASTTQTENGQSSSLSSSFSSTELQSKSFISSQMSSSTMIKSSPPSLPPPPTQSIHATPLSSSFQHSRIIPTSIPNSTQHEKSPLPSPMPKSIYSSTTDPFSNIPDQDCHRDNITHPIHPLSKVRIPHTKLDSSKLSETNSNNITPKKCDEIEFKSHKISCGIINSPASTITTDSALLTKFEPDCQFMSCDNYRSNDRSDIYASNAIYSEEMNGCEKASAKKSLFRDRFDRDDGPLVHDDEERKQSEHSPNTPAIAALKDLSINDDSGIYLNTDDSKTFQSIKEKRELQTKQNVSNVSGRKPSLLSERLISSSLSSTNPTTTSSSSSSLSLSSHKPSQSNTVGFISAMTSSLQQQKQHHHHHRLQLQDQKQHYSTVPTSQNGAFLKYNLKDKDNNNGESNAATQRQYHELSNNSRTIDYQNSLIGKGNVVKKEFDNAENGNGVVRKKSGKNNGDEDIDIETRNVANGSSLARCDDIDKTADSLEWWQRNGKDCYSHIYCCDNDINVDANDDNDNDDYSNEVTENIGMGGYVDDDNIDVESKFNDKRNDDEEEEVFFYLEDEENVTGGNGGSENVRNGFNSNNMNCKSDSEWNRKQFSIDNKNGYSFGMDTNNDGSKLYQDEDCSVKVDSKFYDAEELLRLQRNTTSVSSISSASSSLSSLSSYTSSYDEMLNNTKKAPRPPQISSLSCKTSSSFPASSSSSSVASGADNATLVTSLPNTTTAVITSSVTTAATSATLNNDHDSHHHSSQIHVSTKTTTSTTLFSTHNITPPPPPPPQISQPSTPSSTIITASLSLSTTTDDLPKTSTPASDLDLDPSVKVASKRSRLSSYGDISEGWDPTPPSRSVSSPNCMEGEVRGRGHQRSNSHRSSLLQQSMHNLAKEGREHRSSTISGTSMVFHSRTSLPTQSSPAPLKRNSGGRFDYDSSLVNVKAIKNAFSCSKLALGDKHDGQEDDHLGDNSKRTLSTSAPASTNCLLGNFEESILNGRIDPVGTVSGFSAEIGASGSFCPKHIHLPVSAFFFDLSDDNAPSPYLGHINLRSIGSKKGYHIPKRGTVQVTLFNPNKTVVKMFVVMYDLSDMPLSSQTFIRQRTMYVPCDRNSTAPSYLRYLIHLRCASSRSGKVYLHTDIRLIFARHKLDMDAKTVPYEMKSFTELPKNPKYSPKK